MKVSFPLVFILSCLLCSASQADQNSTPGQQSYKTETLIESLNSPWSLAFLPNGDYLITELNGELLRVTHGASPRKIKIAGVPDIYVAAQGGLFDVLLDRNFEDNQRIYLSYAHGKKSANATRLISAELMNDELSNIKVLFTASPWKSTPQHYGGRIVQLGDGTLLLTVGDGFDYREQAQKLDSHLGKIVRVDESGNAPSNNPWVSDKDALPEIWSIGHRNEQALLVTPSGVVYENEHGPRGGDEINIIQPGNNYGWPVITQGIDYNGASITPYTEYEGMLQPLVDWTPSIAPSAMVFYQGDMFTEWQGDLLVVSLAEKSVRRIDLDDGKVVKDERIFPQLDTRMRDIRIDRQGAIYILTDGADGKLLRLSRNQE